MINPDTHTPGILTTPAADSPAPTLPATVQATRLPANLPPWLAPKPEFTGDDLNGLLNYARLGKSLTLFCKDRHIEPGTLRGWLHSDPHRLARYLEAKAIGAEKVEDEILDIADGSYSGLPQDIQRDTLRVKTRQYLLQVWDRDRYGDKTKVEIGVSVDISEAMRRGQERLERSRGRTFEAEAVTYGRT